MLTFTVFDILLFECRSVSGIAQRVPGSQNVKFSVKNQKKGRLLLELLVGLLIDGRLILGSTQRVPGSEKVKFLVKNQKNIWLLLEFLEKLLPSKLRRFRMVF